MSATRKSLRDASSSPPTAVPRLRSRRKPRAPRARLTHIEVRRGEALRFRISIADDALVEAGAELGALIERIAPSAQTVAATAPEPSDLVVSREHSDEEDAHYHANVREHLVALFGSLCDTSLADALEIAREERTRRAEGGN